MASSGRGVRGVAFFLGAGLLAWLVVLGFRGHSRRMEAKSKAQAQLDWAWEKYYQQHPDQRPTRTPLP